MDIMLDELARKYGTDKSSLHHDYCKVYESYLSSFKDWALTVIEVGYGGYQFIDRGGESSRMWEEYFQNGKVISIDIHQKENSISERREFWQGSQSDSNLLQSIIERELGSKKRVFIDDGSHNNRLTIQTFNIVFPLLKSGDLYFVEDVHTSYWEAIAQDGTDYEGKYEPGVIAATTMEWFTRLTHQLNAEHFAAKYRNEFANKIEFIHFYKEMIVIKRL